jgi:methylated-DNA-[protein]-cysteine S-methyltransferase
VPILVPCHRVIGSDGKLVGFGGGLSRKRFLLALEAWVHIERTFAP